MTIQVRNVAVAIGDKTIVEEVSLQVEPMTLMAVVGPNGAGKSTLLRAVCGELRLKQGEILFNDRSIKAWSSRQQAQMRAILPQLSTLSFNFRVFDVVLMGRSPHVDGVESERDYKIAIEALIAVNMADFADRVYTTLSGGERQRVQLARVLAQIWEESAYGPRFLLLDEPTNNLDLTHQHATLRLAQNFSRQGGGVLAILHDLNLAAQYADQIVVLKEGRKVTDGDATVALTEEVIEEVFELSVSVIDHPTLGCPLIVPNL